MITANFHGQLGNNLFQLATLLAYKEIGYNIFLLDTVNRGTVEQINDFFIHPKKLEFKDMFQYSYNFLDSEYFIGYLKDKFEIYNSPDVSPSGFFGFTDLPKKNFLILNGYFQSEKYFKKIEDKIKNIYFAPSSEVMREVEKYNFDSSVSMHIRRAGDRHLGDMQEYFKDLDFSYYQESFMTVSKLKNIKKVYIFSDSIQWCEQNIKNLVPSNKEVIFVKNNKNYVDLFLMSKCENNIIGNSSFSWWAAWLNKNKEKTVVCPKTNWFGPKLKHMFLNDLFPDEWITI